MLVACGMVMLLDHGACPSVRDCSGVSCLHLAARLGLWKLVALFHAYGAPVDSIDNDGITSLGWVCKHHFDDRNTIRALLALGASVSRSDKEGHTALHNAIIAPSRWSTIRELLHAGASAGQKTLQGETASALAERLYGGDKKPDCEEIITKLHAYLQEEEHPLGAVSSRQAFWAGVAQAWVAIPAVCLPMSKWLSSILHSVAFLVIALGCLVYLPPCRDYFGSHVYRTKRHSITLQVHGCDANCHFPC